MSGMAGEHLLLYDGVCGLCNRVNTFVLEHDARAVFDFAPLQGETARSILRRAGRNPDEMQTFYVLANYRSGSPAVLSRAAAALFVLRQIGGGWRLLTIAGVLPERWLDAVYDAVARRRYAVFGRYDSCPIPSPEHRRRFIDV
jgi:predicted DCC family thiol-disulfide oxidoreductase YuxK